MEIANNIRLLNQAINHNCALYGRKPNELSLMAVSKAQNLTAILAAYEAGITHFGENYCQEALPKIHLLQNLPIIWHFIGPLQSNKASTIAKHFAWVHSVEREKTALLLSKHRPADLPALQICVQININNEPKKAGLAAKEALAFINKIRLLPNLQVRGLMAIPENAQSFNAQYENFLQLANLLKALNQQLPESLDTLSMGMSGDYPAAIKAGSTMLRIGSAIFKTF